MMVKICGITREDDARDAIDCGAGALGFNFYAQSPRYVSPAQAASISTSLPNSILRVGVFVNESADVVDAVMREAGMDVAQLHGTSESNQKRVWKARRVEPDERLAIPAANETAEAFLFDTASLALHGGTGQTFPWSVARGFPHRFLIAGGLDAGNVQQAIAEAQPWGVDSCSRLESSPGKKDLKKVRAFVKAALTANS